MVGNGRRVSNVSRIAGDGRSDRAGLAALRATVAIAADDERDAVTQMLRECSVQVVQVTGDGLEAIAQAHVERPQVVVLGWRLPRCDGFEVMRRILAEMPETAVVLLLLEGDAVAAEWARQAGAWAVMGEGAIAEEWAAVLSGVVDRVWGARSGGGGSAVVEGLSESEQEILRAIAGGASREEAGRRLGMSERAVSAHVASVLGKLRRRGQLDRRG